MEERIKVPGSILYQAVDNAHTKSAAIRPNWIRLIIETGLHVHSLPPKAKTRDFILAWLSLARKPSHARNVALTEQVK